MFKKVLATFMATAMVFTATLQVEAAAKTRKANGVYIDYMTVMTKDGNIWELSDDNKPENKYFKRAIVGKANGKKKVKYVPKFKKGQKVKVTFDTKGTKTKKDDEIINVKRSKEGGFLR